MDSDEIIKKWGSGTQNIMIYEDEVTTDTRFYHFKTKIRLALERFKNRKH